MRYTYYTSLTEDTYVETYFAEITGSDPKYGFKRTFFTAETYDYTQERAYYLSIHNEGVFEQSIKVFSKDTKKLIRRERKWYLYDGNCLHEIARKDVLYYLNKVIAFSLL